MNALLSNFGFGPKPSEEVEDSQRQSHHQQPSYPLRKERPIYKEVMKEVPIDNPPSPAGSFSMEPFYEAVYEYPLPPPLPGVTQTNGTDWLHRHSDAPSLKLPPFIYRDLEDIHGIRLLRILQPPSSDSPLKCTLEHHRLKDCPPFEAISYTWGIPTYTESNLGPKTALGWQVDCDGSACMIPMNLYDALCQLSSFESTRYIWADAICINQMDPVEKSSQILLMGEIYSRTERVVIWLGKDATDIPKVTDFRAKLDVAINRYEGRYGTKSIKEQNPLDEEFIKRLNLCSMKEWVQWWESYFRFYQHHRWFRRAWVVQEIALARSALFLCGDTILPWVDLFELGATIRRNGWRHALSASAGKNPSGGIGDEADNLLEYQRQVQAGGPIDSRFHTLFRAVDGVVSERQRWFAYLKYTIQELRRFQATDSRDKIYSALGLVDPFIPNGLGQPIRPDYTIEPADLYTDVTEVLLKELPILSSLSYVNGISKDLPSWVPDYSRPLSRVPLIHFSYGHIFDAPLIYTFLPIEPRFYGPSIYRRLKLCGAKFAKILMKGLPLQEMRNNLTNLKTNLSLCLSLPRIYEKTSELRIEAFWRTLIADTTERPEKCHPAPPEYADYFDDWLLLLMKSLKALHKEHKAQLSNELNDLSNLLQELRGSSPPQLRQSTYTALSAVLSPSTLNSLDQLNSITSTSASKKGAYLYDRAFRTASTGRCLFLTEEGYLGLGPEDLEVGDELWVLRGARVPFVLREKGGEEVYWLVGEAYVRGGMNGEVLKGRTGEGAIEMRDVVLI